MSLDRSNWLVPIFLILGVLLPAGCVLWFMNEAATSQAAAARQSVAEAYRNQLPLLRDRVEAFWQTRAADLDSKAGAGSPQDFARAVKAGLADAIVYARGYPPPVPALHPDAKPRPEILAAQSQIRDLVRNGNKDAALKSIQDNFAGGALSRATDPQGRLIAADEQLLALQILARGDRRFAVYLQRLVAVLNDYEHVAMPASQRLFLMDEVRALDPSSDFPAIEAERLAAEYLETNTPPKDTWKIASKSGRLVALYRTSTMVAAMRAFLEQQSPSHSVRFDMLPPGVPGTGESMDAGVLLPGWRIAFALLDSKPLDEAARARRASYLWAGFLAIGAMALMGIFAGNIFRRQMRLARLKTDLVAAVSHELKTPLASMRLLVDLLLDETIDPLGNGVGLDPVRTREYLQLILGENQRLSRLIENFLTFSRIERNRQRFEFVRVQPEGVLRSAAHILQERLQTAACRFQVEAASDLPAIQADEDAMIAVLLNLMDNAFKYTTTDKQICARAYRSGTEVIFEVEDNGIGIAAREQKRIFRRFYQVDQRLARETGGCGLGLSIVEFIVKAHGGSVSVRSRPGSGSTFIVRLPCAAEIREGAPAVAPLSSKIAS